ncbi:Protein of unknown function (DUF778), putative [Leishmania lindenbergi]|uniref:LRAT domain-containing protein n=1 Tax=Leishmania lindenbergi TaxID=651832 RepID=A0AAW3A7J1_9TRYP
MLESTMENRGDFSADMPVQLPPTIDPVHEHYPFCIVWSPIPILTWFLPFVGHIAVCDSQGRIYDFQESYRIGQDRMLFGNPVKYWDISRDCIPSFYNPDPHNSQERWAAVHREVEAYDAAVASATNHFRQAETYNFFANNCHAFVAAALNRSQLQKEHTGTVSLAIGMLLHGRYVSLRRFMKAHLPSILLVFAILILSIML